VSFCAFYTLFASELKQRLTLAKSICGLNLILPMVLVVPFSQTFAPYYLESKFSLTNDIKSNPMFLWLKEHNSPDITIATSLAGELPLTVDYNHIDILGLNDSVVANEGTFDPNGPIDSKTKMSYVVGRKPEIIEAYVKPECVKTADVKCLLKGRPKMVMELFGEASFQSDYLLITNAPYEHFDRAMFIRKDYYQAKAKTAGIEAVKWSVSIAK